MCCRRSARSACKRLSPAWSTVLHHCAGADNKGLAARMLVVPEDDDLQAAASSELAPRRYATRSDLVAPPSRIGEDFPLAFAEPQPHDFTPFSDHLDWHQQCTPATRPLRTAPR